MKLYKLSPIILALTLPACTSLNITPINKFSDFSHICIEDNPRVKAHNFVFTITDLFHDHQITSEVYKGDIPLHCEYTLKYTALQSWDYTLYLSHAELRLYKGKHKIGDATYHLNMRGFANVNKWTSTESKMTPVISELLQNYR